MVPASGKSGIFLSWSGKRSRLLAQQMAAWLPTIHASMKPWLSTDDIAKGSVWMAQLRQTFETHRVGIFCVTPENVAAPWLMYEAGAFSTSEKNKVIPLLLGLASTDVSGPLGHFQVTTLDQADLWRLVRSLNEDLPDPVDSDELARRFKLGWPKLVRSIRKISNVEIAGDGAAIDSMVQTLTRNGIAPAAGARPVNFDKGFETHALYSALTRHASRRLLLLGRKNRKLFDKEHSDFFTTLRGKIANGFDFRVLFIDPGAPVGVLRQAHRDDDFDEQLRTSLRAATRTLAKNGIDADQHCRTYAVARTASFVIADEAVAYGILSLDELGRSLPLTNSSFSLVGAPSRIGRDLLSGFESLWVAGGPMPAV